MQKRNKMTEAEWVQEWLEALQMEEELNMASYNVGDRVEIKKERSKYNGKYGDVIEVIHDKWYGHLHKYVVRFDDMEPMMFEEDELYKSWHRGSKCECGGEYDSIENHYDWCPKYYTWKHKFKK